MNREEIQQVLLNLLLNAEHAVIGRGTDSVDADRGRDTIVSVEVHDDGPGVPAAVAGRVFEPFFSTKEVGQGTGLGLSIALGIVESHQGTLRLLPTAAGACFQLALPPLAVGDAADLRPATARPASRRALVVDDEPSVRAGLQRVLSEHGFLVDGAEGGRQALGMIEQNRYDIVLCDIDMPEMGGIALYDVVRERRLSAVRRFVFVSEDTLSPQVQTFIEAVQLPMLPKPIDPAALVAAFDSLLAHDANRNAVGSRLSAAS